MALCPPLCPKSLKVDKVTLFVGWLDMPALVVLLSHSALLHIIGFSPRQRVTHGYASQAQSGPL